MVVIFKLIGVIGLLLICAGILNKKRKKQDVYYILGGIFLAMYSIYLKDVIFIILQIFFTISAIYDFVTSRSNN